MLEAPQLGDFVIIGGGFFNYAQEIAKAVARRGRTAVCFEDRPALDTYTKTMLRVAPRLVAAKSDAYFEGIIRQLSGQPIRDVLVIKGEALSGERVARLRAAMPQAKFTLYFWDSYRNMPRGSDKKVSGFDRAFTFDPIDARNDSRLEYRPLFYIPEYRKLADRRRDIDLLFIGTAHSDRYAVIRRLAASMPKSLKFERVLYFPSKLVYSARRIFDSDFWQARRDEFIFKPLSKIELITLIERSRAVLDIERTSQFGLTIRTVEVFGAGRKLVTTNSRIVHTDLFNPKNIKVIDRRRPRIDAGFLAGEYDPPAKELLARYSLDGWLDEVLPDVR